MNKAKRRRFARIAYRSACETACPRHDPERHDEVTRAAWAAVFIAPDGSPRKRPETQGAPRFEGQRARRRRQELRRLTLAPII